ncbi:MAG TPA: potassium-transporting ATPase subunit KdpA [Thermoplasmata archaeon]|nr:potassium-transporting ATPase subunit KdpA [Thermoplasmata archaeon]
MTVGLFLAALFGRYMARVYLGRPTALDGLFNPIERAIFRLLGVDARRTMGWKEYAACLLVFNAVTTAMVFLLLLFQGALPWNALGAPGMEWTLATHTASSFNTNTDFQHYTGEPQVSLFASLFGLQVEMFTSAASGLAVGAAFIRGFVRRDATVGNFWWDMTRSLVRILLPVSLVAAGLFVLLDVPQTFAQSAIIHPLGGGTQVLPLGPLSSWDAIELIGTNGGGFFGANMGHPFQNPTAATNFLAVVLMMLIPFGAIFMFGNMVRRPGEAAPLLVTAVVIFLLALVLFTFFESANPFLQGTLPLSQDSGYLVGAEARFSLPESALFQVASIYGNVGANTMSLGSLTPGAQMVLLWGMFLQSAPGGDGTGFGTLLINALLAIFVGGLMVGRTPEYLGKKIGRGEVKWAAVTVLSHPFAILIPVAVAYVAGLASLAVSPGPHGFTIVLYEFTSESANNGSGMGPINDATPFFNLAGAIVMLFSRYLPMIAMLAIGGSLARQTPLPPGPGTIKTESATFTLYLIAFILIVTGLLFLPVLALGPFGQGGL